ncbi:MULTISPECIES: type VI secretion system baseplate subunit TssK [Vibrio]|jgi:type VI secretion system protein ImpJ|uniref:Type VI secretion system baseplate subunit TssK n=4 Tax=Vibrio harveyi TaxID=669 RepID=A0A8B3DEG6_VIBHA|nr:MULTISPECIES: type VI secretion system baseplate subunit TssK [Vibrio]APP07651.1 type VI secretion system-associated protein [Vibrio harveyi]EKO3782416.1 type VI secretion system baseplate subunit TssK [Vibrio harveyi]EKO3803210.1 type VI secretion system baseplate subunit TssK [Vibrio harveyi]EKO3822951.1 type VI secretion system baseplate subunit TssK [Vibrio harveyi]EKO3843748.1 type VI secretion system baseplate subunit TssK [Vibrio harveyi]
MADYSHTAWCEGMFLRPQHFQQSERAFEHEFKGLNRFQQPYNWGVYQVRINPNSLKEGVVEIEKLEAILPDMTLIELQNVNEVLPPLLVEKGTQNTLVKVVVASSSLKEKTIADVSEGVVSRYVLNDLDVIDVQTGQDEERIQVASLNVALKVSNDNLSGFVELPILKIKEVTAEGAILLDEEYTPPHLNVLKDQAMLACLKNVTGMTKIRADVVSQRLVQGKAASASAVDFIMLQMLNRYETILRHLGQLEQVHPLEFVTLLRGYVGELSTFSSKNKRAPLLIDYEHSNLTSTISELNQVLSQYLSVVLDQTANKLPLEVRQLGIRVTPLPDKRLLESSQFVLAVKADTSTDEIRRLVPAQLKLGPAEQIRDLINNQINGINVAPLNVVPRQIPYQTGYVYFEVIKKGPFWVRLQESGGIALQLSGQFPNSDIELWSINQ